VVVSNRRTWLRRVRVRRPNKARQLAPWLPGLSPFYARRPPRAAGGVRLAGRGAVLRPNGGNVNKLSLDFSQDRDLEAIRAKVLAFLKANAVDSATIICVIQGAGKAGSPVRHRHLLDPGHAIETHAGEIASVLVEYAKGKNGKKYSGATLEVRHS
jgi:hypothetical protein